MKTQRPERDLRNAILALLRAHGIAAWPTGVGAFPASYQGRQRFVRLGSKGMSDIVGIVPCAAHGVQCPVSGRFLAVEVKSPGGKVSAEQTAFLQTVVKAGGLGFVAHSCDEVVAKLGLGGSR